MSSRPPRIPPAVRGDPAAVQRRTLRLLFGTQILGGVGVTIGVSVGALLAARLGGVGVSGLGQSCVVVGAALLAVPVSRLMSRSGRRPGLVLAYLVGAAGAGTVVAGAVLHWLPVFFAGMLMFGGGSAANLQARYTAVDLAPAHRRAWQLSMIVWATTIGAVAAPNFAALADRAVARFALPALTGPFLFSAVAFLLVAGLVFGLLRPDPLLTARSLTDAESTASADEARDSPSNSPSDGSGVGPADGLSSGPGPVARSQLRRASGRDGLRATITLVARSAPARLGIVAVAVGHLVMVSVMSMTPVHLGQMVHGDVLTVVGVVLSVHIAGMYALAPVVGWLADRLGRRPVITIGLLVLLAACLVAGTAGHATVRLGAGLALLGLGWSGTMVGGSTLLTEAVPVADRPAVQGLSDLTMGLAGAGGGALSGVVVQLSGYPTLTLVAAVATVPLLGLALRRPVPAAREV